MTRLAVIANEGKTLAGAGLDDLRGALPASVLWYQVPKSRHAPERAREALEAGADVVLVWGGDGTVQRTAHVLAGSGVPIGILPAGTANLLAAALGIPHALDDALDVALHGDTNVIDVGILNGERFVVMAGTGFDALMIAEADGGLKDRFGRLAYLWTGWQAMSVGRTGTRIAVDGRPWFEGAASCVLLGNIGRVGGGIVVFPDARPDDGRLEVGVSCAEGRPQWLRAFGRLLLRRPSTSPLLRTTSGTRIDVELDDAVLCELDGGDREAERTFRVTVEPAALAVRVPRRTSG